MTPFSACGRCIPVLCVRGGCDVASIRDKTGRISEDVSLGVLALVSDRNIHSSIYSRFPKIKLFLTIVFVQLNEHIFFQRNVRIFQAPGLSIQSVIHVPPPFLLPCDTFTWSLADALNMKPPRVSTRCCYLRQFGGRSECGFAPVLSSSSGPRPQPTMAARLTPLDYFRE